MEQIKNQMIEALRTGNMEEVKRLKPEYREEVARNKWMESHTENGGIPIAAWLEPNPFLNFVEPETK